MRKVSPLLTAVVVGVLIASSLALSYATATSAESTVGRENSVAVTPGRSAANFSPFAITAGTYSFTNFSAIPLEDMSSGTTQLVASNQDNTASPVTNIGFDFWFDGVRQTQFSVNANGLLRLGSALVSNSGANDLANATDVPQITPYWDDLHTGTNGKVHFKVVGSAPNRKLVVEWQNMQIPRVGNNNAGGATFQCWLYETTGIIEFVYGSGIAVNSANGGYSVGFGSSAVAFASVTTVAPTVAYGTSNNTQTNAITSGTKYTFTPLTPADPTALNFTAVTPTSMTLNWTDNSSNELGFVIYRSDDGGTTYNFVTQTVAGATSSVQSFLVPGTTYFWRVFAVSEGALSANPASGSNTTNAPGNIISTTTGGLWSSTGTWVNGVVPTATDNVIIADGATVTIDVTTAACLNLVVGQGSSGSLEYISTPASTLTVNGDLSVTSGGTFTAGSGSLSTHILSIGGANQSLAAGNLTVEGAFDLNTTAGVTTNFLGSSNGTVSGSGATCDFWAIVTNKGSNAVVDVSRVITMSSPTSSATRLTVTNGTFKLSSASTLTPYFGNQTIAASNGRLWISNASASIQCVGTGVSASGSGSPTIAGTLQVDAGTFGYGQGNNAMSLQGSLIIGGPNAVVNMFGRVTTGTSPSFTMTAGNFNVDPQNITSAAANDVFVLTTGSVVNFTGGTVTIVDPSANNSTAGNTEFEVAGTAAPKNFAGSTIRFGDGVSSSAGNATNGGFSISAPSTVTLGTIIVNNPAGTNRNVRISSTISTVCNIAGLTLTAGTFNLNGNTLTTTGDLANDGSINGDVTGSVISFVGGSQQTVSGSGGYINNRIRGLTINNTSGSSPGVNLNQSVAVTTALNLSSGSLGGIGTLTLGDSAASLTLTTTRSGGSLANVPTFNLTGVTYNVTYTAPSPAAAITTGSELPSSISGTLTINNSSGVTLNSPLTVNTGLTLTSGLLGTTATNLLTLGSTITGPAGSATSFVNGPLAIDIPTTAAISRTYAIGKGTAFRPVTLSSLSLASQSIVTAEVINSASGGTPVPPLQTLDPSRYWQVSNTAALNSSARIRLTYDTDDNVFDTTPARVGQANASNGNYSSIGGSVTGTTFSGTIISTLNLTPGDDYFTIASESSLPVSWDGGAATSNWGDALNWSNDTVPDGTTDVSLSLGSPTTISVNGTFAVKNLTVGTNTTLNFGSGTLNITGNYIQSSGTVSINTGNLNVTGSSTLTGGSTNVNSGTYLSTGAFTLNGGTLANDTGTLNCKVDFTLTSGNFTVTTGTSGGSTIFSGTSIQNITGFPGGTSLNNLTFQAGGAGVPKMLTAGRTITAANDLVVSTTAQLALSAASATTINVGGNLNYGGVTGGTNIGSLTLNLTGTGKTINGTSLASKPTSLESRIASEDVKTETINMYSDPMKYRGVRKDKSKLENTYLKKRAEVDALIAKKDSNTRLVINLDDTTIVSNADTFEPLAPTPSAFEMNLTIASGANYTMLDNISIASGRTLNVTGRLNADTFTISGAGNVTVTGSTVVVGNGTIGTATASASGFGATLINTGINLFTDAIIEYNANGAQTINATNHPSAAMIYTAGSGTKTLNGNKTISGDSGDPLTKAALFVGSGTTFADGGFTLSFTSLLGFANVIVDGTYLSTGSGGLSYESGPTFSSIQAVDGTQFGNLTLNFAFSDESISLNGSGTSTFTFRNMTFGGTAGAGVAGGTLQLNQAGTTNVIVTGNVSISPITTSNNGGGFGGTPATTGTVTVRGNITTTSTNATQPIFDNNGTNTLIIGHPSVLQTLTLGGNATIFTGSKLQIDNPAGLQLGGTGTRTLGAGGTMTVSTGASFFTGTNTFINSGTTTVNGSFVINTGGTLSGGAGTYTYHPTTGTLVFNLTTAFTTIDANRTFWPATNGPQNVSVIGSFGISMSVARTVGILFQSTATVSGTTTLTCNGTCRINTGGSFTTAPTFGSSSLLVYNSGGTFARGSEWSATSGAGFPNDVQISNNTLLNLGAGSTSTARAIARNLTIDAGSTLSTNEPSNRMTATLSVPGALLINGTVTLSSMSGGDLNVGGNWTNNSTFTNNSRTVTFNGSAAQIIVGTASTTFAGLAITNTAGVNMNTDCSVTGVLTLNGDLTVDSTNGKILTATGSTSAGTKDVIGTVQRTDVGGTARAFGNPNNLITNGSAMTLQVLLAKASPPGFSAAVNRIYSLNVVSGSVSSATVRLHYLDTELNGNVGASLHLWRATGSPVAAWTDQGVPNSTQTAADPNNWIQNTAVTGFSAWTFASAPAAPTAVKLTKFNALNFTDGVQLDWESGFEVNNLGYHLYREQNGKRVRVTPAVVAGSALKVGRNSKLTAGYSYSWLDRQGTPDSAYYLESIDLNGARELTGPIYPARAAGASRTAGKQRARLLNEVASTSAAPEFEQSWPASMEATPLAASDNKPSKPPLASATASGAVTTQQTIAGGRAVKISVKHNGWYRVTQPELLAAGLDPNSDPRRLQLYADGEEVPLMMNGGEGQLRADDSIEFYGQALDTLTTDTHVYWLINGTTSGKRINRPKPLTVKPGNTDSPNVVRSGSFALTTERKDKMVYFAGLLNGEGENIFGPPVTSYPATQTLTVRNLDGSTTQAQLTVTLQGATDVDHQVQVELNGTPVGTISFNGRQHPSQSFSVNRSLLRDGDNTLTLTANGGDADVSLIDSVALTYAHSYRADDNSLRFSVASGQTVVVTGFTSSAIRVIDLTNPGSPNEVGPTTGPLDAGYGFKLHASGTGRRTYLAFTDVLASQPALIAANQPSNLKAAQSADMLIVTHRDFREAIEPLAGQRRAEGLAVTVVDIEDVYDEFSFGSHTPDALRDFLSYAGSQWTRAPRYLLLVGDSSWDPRNYLDQGFGDFVPTKLIDTVYLETASDDWLADFDGDGVANIAVGRLPGRTATEVSRMVSKLVSYEHERQMGTPLRGALMVADAGFEGESQATAALLPTAMTIENINRAEVGSDDLTRSQIVDGINDGPLIVNYFGHGSVTVWTGAGLLDSDLAGTLTNNNKQAFFVMMTCLNGYTHDAYIDSLAESLLKAENGGAMAVWASSGFTEPEPQFAMSSQFYRQLFTSPSMRIGDAFKPAKAAISDPDVRRTWMLFGDPSMRIR